MTVTLRAQNYRGLKRVDWSIPEGVSVLTGPNGSGKTTLLTIPKMIRLTEEHGLLRAAAFMGGVEHIRNWNAPIEEPSTLYVATSNFSLDMRLPLSLSPDRQSVEARLAIPSGQEIIRQANGQLYVLEKNGGDWDQPFGKGSVLKAYEQLWDTTKERFVFGNGQMATASESLLSRLSPLQDAYEEQSYELRELRNTGSSQQEVDFLFRHGLNIFSLLRSWGSQRKSRSKFDFVLQTLSDAIPGFEPALDLRSVGQVTFAEFFQSTHPDQPRPHHLAPNGWFVALLHLAAVASTPDGGLVMFDEFENALHPHAIRTLIEAFRAYAAEHHLHIVLTTHSPTVLHEFSGEYLDYCFVTEPGRDTTPTPVVELGGREWLSRFSLGDLYRSGDIGAPAPQP